MAENARKRIKAILNEMKTELGVGAPVGASEEERSELASVLGLDELPAAVDEMYRHLGGEGDLMGKALFEGLFDPSVSVTIDRAIGMHRKNPPSRGAVPFGETADTELWIEAGRADPKVWGRTRSGEVVVTAEAFSEFVSELGGMRLAARRMGWEDPIVSVRPDDGEVVVALSSMIEAAESALAELKRL